MKNKKAAFEMSITTVVILVIAVIMLILGLVFVRTIMCRGLQMAATTLEGAENEINKFFGQEVGKEIVCMGTKTPLVIVPGRYNVVGCGFRPDVRTTYSYEFTLESAMVVGTGESITATARTWITEATEGTITVEPGETLYATFGIQPPKKAPHTILVFKVKIDGADKDRMRFEVRPIGWLQERVC